ncbi:MAG TPA: acyltransferase [Bradyrhizobium sp.]|nr:acyltransferase [Bradyrhizobium sp.]
MEPRRYAYIDALRGYAILMVIAVHASQLVDDARLQFLASQGARGVQLFFVASAITLCMSWKARHDGAGPFYLRRFFRIAPMFYLALGFFLWLRGLSPNGSAPYGLGLHQILMTVTFTHGFLPDAIDSIVPGSWSIADEMVFYAIFPLVIAAVSSARFARVAIACAILLAICCAIEILAVRAVHGIADPVRHDLAANFVFLWFVNQAPCFLFGCLVFKWSEEGGDLRRGPAAALVIGSLCAMALIAIVRNQTGWTILLPMLYGALFAALALGLTCWQPAALVNPVIGWIGKVSYSGYLIHLALIAAVPLPRESFSGAFVVLLAATLALSAITYRCIEQPFNNAGRRLAQRWTSRTTAPAARRAEAA